MHASAENVPACGCMPDVLLCAGCVPVGSCGVCVCVTAIGWSGRVVWVSRHEQLVSLCRSVLRWCVAVCAALHAGVVARRAGSGFAKWAGACLHADDSAAMMLTVVCAFDGRVVVCI